MNSTISKSKGVIVTVLLVLLTLVSNKVTAQTRVITGVVSDEAGPLPGAIVLSESMKYIAANYDGVYILEAKMGETLRFYYAGYATQSMVVGSSSKIDVRLVYLERDQSASCSRVPKMMHIKGVITDSLNPLQYAEIRVEGQRKINGSRKNIKCDENGKYDFSAYPESTLVFSSNEYKPKKIQLAHSQDLDVTLVQKRTFFGRMFHSIGNLFR